MNVMDTQASPPPFDTDAVPVEEATRHIHSSIRPIEQRETIPIGEAIERILADDLISTIDVPAHDNAAMDGYSCSSGDLCQESDSRLLIVGQAYAGRPFAGVLEQGQAVRIMTGAIMPAAHDTVVAQEHVRLEDGHVLIPRGQQAGKNRRLRGEDLQRGAPALYAGQRLGPAELGLIASLGLDEVKVKRRLRVAILSTGDELRAPGAPLRTGEIYDSNRYTLAAMLKRMDVEVTDLGIVRDEPQELEAVLSAASKQHDAIISSAGVSVGEADFTRSVMSRLGHVDFWKIAMRPGRPLAFGRIGRALYFGLPGNPVAVMMTFLFIVREALLALSGAKRPRLLPVRAKAMDRIRKRSGRTEYQRGFLQFETDGSIALTLMPNQGSAVLSSMSQADCIVVLEHDSGTIEAGQMVNCIPLSSLI
jgi:molybdopterin molybdotransferase